MKPHEQEIEHSRSQRSDAAEKAIAIKASFPAELKTLLANAVVHSYPPNSKKLAAACQTHNASIAELTNQADASIEQLQKALEAADDPATYGNVFNVAEACRIDRAELGQQAVAICVKACELAESVRAELIPIPAKLANDAEAVVLEVKEQLSQIGSGLENMPAYGKNGGAAERQFDHSVRFFNARARAALVAAKDSASQVTAAAQQVYSRKRQLEETKAFLHQIAVKEINR